jgi:cytochrome P450
MHAEFDPYADQFFAGDWDTYRRLRDCEPVHRNSRLDFWVLSRYEDVSTGFRDWATYSSAQGTMLDQLNTPGFTTESMPGWLLVYDPPAHTRLRQLAISAFTPRAVDQLEDAVRRAVTRAADSVVGRTRFDLVEDFAKSIPGEVMFDLMGVPEDGRRRATELFDDFLYAGDEGETGEFNQTRVRAMNELMQYLGGLVQEKRANPGDDITSRLFEATYHADGVDQRLNDDEMCLYLLLLLSAGTETTAKLVGSAAVALSRNPEQWARVLADPSVIPSAVTEAGRYESPVQFLGRKTTRDVMLHGTSIPADSNVLLLVGSANRDERVYPDPDRFDIDREFARPPLTYGWGPHLCLGMHLARLEVQAALEEIRLRWPDYTVDSSGLERLRGFHVFGWAKVPVTVTANDEVAASA